MSKDRRQQAAMRGAGLRLGLLYAISSLGLGASTGCTLLGERLQSEPYSAMIPTGDVLIPVDWWCDFAVVQVFLDGQGPFNFLLDTGASETIVTPEVAALFPKQTFRIRCAVRGSSGRRVAIKSALTVNVFQAGALRLQDFDALVIDLSAVSDAIGNNLDGILGCPLFSGSLLRIDYPKREVRVQVGTLAKTKRDDQFRTSGNRRPFVGVTVGGETYPVLVDTGSRGGLSLKKSVFRNQQYQDDPVAVSAVVGITGKPRVNEAARLTGSATIGPHVLHQPIVQVAGGASLLGVKVLRHFAITYDYNNNLIRLERAEETPILMAPLRSTGVGLRRNPARWSVWTILPFAIDAAKELQIGDIVTKVAGIPVADYDCAAFADLSMTRETIDLEIQRDADTMTVTLPVFEVVP